MVGNHGFQVSLLPPPNLSPSVAEHRARIVQTLEEAKQLIQSNTQRAQLKMKARYDQSARPIQFMIGQRVWVYTPKHRKGLSKKLLHNYHGPFRIVAKLSPATFPSCSHPTHAAAAKVPTSTANNGNKIYDAERIVRRRVHRGKPEYLIKWRGYAKRYNTWEPPDHILDERLWDDYYHRYPEHRTPPPPTLGEEH